MEDATYQYAYFANVDKTVINIEWLHNDEIIEETIPFDVDYYKYQELLNHVTLDGLYSNTVERKKAERKAFKETVIQIAKEDGLIYTENQSTLATELINVLTRDEEEIDKKELFQFKLSIFESPIVADSKKSKTKLRQAKTYKEIILELIKFIK